MNETREMTAHELTIKAQDRVVTLAAYGHRFDPRIRRERRAEIIGLLEQANGVDFDDGYSAEVQAKAESRVDTLEPEDEVYELIGSAVEAISLGLRHTTRSGLGPALSAALDRLHQAQALLYPSTTRDLSEGPFSTEMWIHSNPAVEFMDLSSAEAVAATRERLGLLDQHPVDKAIADVFEPVEGSWSMFPQEKDPDQPVGFRIFHRSGYHVDGEGETWGAALDDAVRKALELRS